MININKLRFGTAGIPNIAKGTSMLDGIRTVRKLSLDAMEMEFVQKVYLKEEKTEEVKIVAGENDIILTSHGEYWINLNSKDAKIVDASINRIYNSAKITYLTGGYSTCFHAAYYSKDEHKKVYDIIKSRLKFIVNKLKDENIKIWIRPETGGKIDQFADSYEIIRLASELEMVLPCFDLAHQYARTLGKWNSYEEFRKLFGEIENKLGKEGLHNMHIHTEGIEFTERGERNHVNLKECKFNYKDLVKVWKEFNIKGIVICESPNIEEDALLLKKTYEKA